MSTIELETQSNAKVNPAAMVLREASIAEDVLLRARSALAESPVLGIRKVHVRVSDRKLVISGIVRSYYHKQQAQEAVRALARGFLVVNDIEVIADPVFPPGHSVR